METEVRETLTPIFMEILKNSPPIKAKIQFTKFILEIPGEIYEFNFRINYSELNIKIDETFTPKKIK